MSICTICRQPSRRIKNMMICSNGHTVHVVEEANEERTFFLRVQATRRKTRVKKDKAKKPKRELATMEEARVVQCITYLSRCAPVFGISVGKFEEYLPLVYGMVEMMNLPYYLTRINATKTALLILYLIKRDLAEEKHEAYLIADFRRQLFFDKQLPKILPRMTKKKGLGLREKETDYKAFWSTPLTLNSILPMLRRLCPGRKALYPGIYGHLNDNMLDAFCCMLALTKTARMKESFERFKEGIVQIQFVERYGFVFAEQLVGAFIYLYFINLCRFNLKVKDSIKVCEQAETGNSSSIEQHFYSREATFFSFKRACEYLSAMEKSRGQERPDIPVAPPPLRTQYSFGANPKRAPFACYILTVISQETGISLPSFVKVIRKVTFWYRSLRRHL